MEPEAILFDEPCSALDPIATAKIEDLIEEIKDGVYRGDSHAQYAAGSEGVGLYGFFHARRAYRVRQDEEDIYDAREQDD